MPAKNSEFLIVNKTLLVNTIVNALRNIMKGKHVYYMFIIITVMNLSKS